MNEIDDKIKQVTAMMRTMTKAESEFKLDFVPVIFANGDDDDTTGMIAALNDDCVQYNDKIYEPGEDLEFIESKFGFNRQILLDGVNCHLTDLIRVKYSFRLTCKTRLVRFEGCSYNAITVVRM